jgi:hypothetical protein
MHLELGRHLMVAEQPHFLTKPLHHVWFGKWRFKANCLDPEVA